MPDGEKNLSALESALRDGRRATPLTPNEPARELYHAVHPQPGCGARWSVIFRMVRTHMPVDAVKAARANSEDHLFKKKRKLEAGFDLRAWLAPASRRARGA